MNYFGLPGEELLDVRSWHDLLGEVAAVERSMTKLLTMDETVNMQIPALRFIPHYGPIDQVILHGRGRLWMRGGQNYQPWVTTYNEQSRSNGWHFDVVNLDYFGPFLPEEGGVQARQRADALKKLFDIDRLDARGRWVLLMTVEANLMTEELNILVRQYLRGVQGDASESAVAIIDFLTQPAVGNQHVTAARLIHATAASLVTAAASQANLSPSPRGTILYLGWKDQPMIHLAYEFDPLPAPISPPTPQTRLLRSPLLTITTQSADPELVLLREQPPNLSEADIRMALDFLGNAQVERLVAQLP